MNDPPNSAGCIGLAKLNDVALYEVYEKKIPSSAPIAGQAEDGIYIDYSLAELLHNVKDLNGNPYVVDGKLKFEDEMVMDVTNNFYEQLGEVVESQKADVREQYEGTEQWMKGPHGEPTNLTERQWLLVHTPSFKEWFGDWEVVARIQALLKSKAIDVSTSNPLINLSGKELETEAKKLFRDKYQKDGETILVTTKDNKHVTLGMKGVKK